jgi:hypothetical protein
MSKNWEKKRFLFELYSMNLSAVKSHSRVRIEPDIDNIYMCPICFEYFTRDEVLAKPPEDILVTIEHIPPEALSGKVRTLTCLSCNVGAGYELDSHLLHKLLVDDFIEGVPSSSVDAKVELNDEIKLTATIDVQKERHLRIVLDPSRSKPEEISKLNELKHFPTVNMSFRGRRGKYYTNRRPEAALLRIAYLWAFSEFGYGFLINDSLKYVRAQIKNPSSNILPTWGISSRSDFPDESLGVNIITKPIELQSFLIIFDVYSELRKVRYGVILPGPTNPGPKVYEFFQDREKATDHETISFIPIPHNTDYLTNSEFCFISHEMWKSLRST